jgi:hypothetical protein
MLNIREANVGDVPELDFPFGVGNGFEVAVAGTASGTDEVDALADLVGGGFDLGATAVDAVVDNGVIAATVAVGATDLEALAGGSGLEIGFGDVAARRSCGHGAPETTKGADPG